MERSIEYPVARPAPRSWIRQRETAAVVDSEGPKIAFKLLIVFLLVLYSNVTLIYKLDALRPALVIAMAALGMMVIELGQARQSFKLTWPESAMVIAFFGACIISTPNAIWVGHALDQTIDLGKILLVYILLENVITNEQRLRTIMFVMVIGGLFPAIGTIDHYRAGILVEHSRAAWRGIFGNPNEAAYGIVILIPIALILAAKSGWPMRTAIGAVLAIYLIALFLTFSRGGLLSLFVVLGMLGWKQKSAIIKIVMVAALVGGLLVIGAFWTRSSGTFGSATQEKDTSVQERIWTFQAGTQMFLHNPLLGVGPGDSSVAYALYAPMAANCGCHNQLVIHNAFIQVLGELGLAGFIPFMVFIFYSMYEAWKLEKGPVGSYAMALGLAMWGLVVCGMSGGYAYTWWPYILVGLIAAAKRISAG